MREEDRIGHGSAWLAGVALIDRIVHGAVQVGVEHGLRKHAASLGAVQADGPGEMQVVGAGGERLAAAVLRAVADAQCATR